jgi:hypothetical protein
MRLRTCPAAGASGPDIHRVFWIPGDVLYICNGLQRFVTQCSATSDVLLRYQGVKHRASANLYRSSTASRPLYFAGPLRVRTTMSALLMPQLQPDVSRTLSKASPI